MDSQRFDWPIAEAIHARRPLSELLPLIEHARTKVSHLSLLWSN